MSVLVIVEHNNQSLNPATLNTVNAGLKLSDSVDLLVLGHNCDAVVNKAKNIVGVARVLQLQAAHFEHQLAEELSPVISAQAKQYTAVLAPASTFGKNILPRVAAVLDVQMLSEVMAIEGPKTFKRPIYAGNVIASFESLDPIQVMTIRTTAFEAAEFGDSEADVVTIDATEATSLSAFESEQLAQSDRPELGAADIVISGGRGLGSAENFDLVYQLADKLNAAVGASRAAVDAGYVPNDMQVGQTGKIVAPQLYVAVGISGAIQHLAGMKDSKVIVAINKDEDAPIFQVADYGLVADLFEVVPELMAKL